MNILLIPLLFFISLVSANFSENIFLIFTGNNFNDTRKLTSTDDYQSLIGTKYFNASRPTVLIIFGFDTNYSYEITQTIVNAYLSRGDHNIIAIDWGIYSKNINYVEVVMQLNEISLVIVDALEKMRAAGFNLETFHFVGFSLGAHMAALIARNFALKNDNYLFKRITGLDPAGLLFYKSEFYKPLSKGDAKFVDIIHTDIDFFGLKNATADVDFYPNGGRMQPGCELVYCLLINNFNLDKCIVCSHSRAWKLYAESVAGGSNVFSSLKCENNVTEYNKVNCQGPATASMGFYADRTAVEDYGVYFLETNKQSPYSKS